MCGRYTLKTRAGALAEHFDLPEVPVLTPRYNIAPSQPVAVVRGGPELAQMRWGLIPAWADDPAIGHRMINARAETVAERPAFRAAFRRRRCLVLADGFYEWQRQDGRKQPFYFRLRDGGPFAFAGLWERWEKGDEPIESCTLLTTEANAVVDPVHDRMPVVLDPGDYRRWLDPRVDRPDELQPLLRPYPAAQMVAHPVGLLVNDPRRDEPRCIEPPG
jgi:putative SOS response-associated peptidase YedK